MGSSGGQWVTTVSELRGSSEQVLIPSFVEHETSNLGTGYACSPPIGVLFGALYQDEISPLG